MPEVIPDLNPQFSTEELYAAWQQIARKREQMFQSNTPVQGAEMLAQALRGGFMEVVSDVEAAWVEYQEGRITESQVRVHINAGIQAAPV